MTIAILDEFTRAYAEICALLHSEGVTGTLISQ